jgi:hypothetical protein
MSMVRGTVGHERLDSRFGFEDMLDRIRQLQVSCAGAVAALDDRFDRGASTTDCIQVRFDGSPAHLPALFSAGDRCRATVVFFRLAL